MSEVPQGAGAEALARATEAARESGAEVPEDWPEVAASIKHRVRSVLVPSRPVLTFTAEGRPALDDAGHAVTRPSRDLVVRLRTRLQQPSYALVEAHLEIMDRRLAAVRIDVVARYGVPLRELLDDLWPVVADLLVDELGPDPDFDPARDLQVRLVDVVDGDPSLT